MCGLELCYIPDCLNVCLHTACLPTCLCCPSISAICLCVCHPVQLSVYPAVFVHLPSFTSRTSLFQRPVPSPVYPHSNVETPEPGQELGGLQPAGAAIASSGWQRVPTVGTLWHHWARGKYRGEEEMTVHYAMVWGVTDKQDHPTNMQSRAQSTSQITRNIFIWGDMQPYFFVTVCHMTITGCKNSHVLLLCLRVQSVFVSFPLNFDPVKTCTLRLQSSVVLSDLCSRSTTCASKQGG